MNISFSREANNWITSNWLICLVIFVLNFVLKFIYIDHLEIGIDEPFTLFYANADFEFLLNMLEHENNPPLFTVILKGWVSIFGLSPTSVRFLPLVFSALTAVSVFHLGRKFFSKSIGITTALIFTFSNYHLFFAHEARPYALFGLLAVLSINSFLEVTLNNSKKHLIYLALLNALLIYNHFLGFFLLFIQFLSYLSISEIRKNHSKSLFISWGITALLYLPYLPILFHRFTESSGGSWLKAPGSEGLYNNIRRFSNEPVVAVLFLAIMLFSGIYHLVRKANIKVAPQYKVAIIWFFVSYLLMFALSFKIAIFIDRYLLFTSFGFYFLVVIGVHQLLIAKKWKYIGSAILCVLMIATVNLKYGSERNESKIIQEVAQAKNESTVILICPDWHRFLFAYHYDLEIFKDYKHLNQRLASEGIYPINSSDDLTAEKLENASTVIYFDAWSELVDPKKAIHTKLNQDFKLTEVNTEENAVHVFYYTRK